MRKMLCNVCRPFLAVVFAAAVFTACSKDDPEVTNTNEGKTKLPIPVLASSELNATSFVVEWPAVDNATVYAYALNGGMTTQTAPEEGMLYTSKTKLVFSKLKENTAYTVRVKAIALSEDKTFTDSEYVEIKVTTLDDTSVDDPFTFDEKVVIATGATIDVIPVDPNALYIAINASKNAIEASTIDEYLQNVLYQSYFWIEDWTKPDGTMIFQGKSIFSEGVGLYPERDYVLIAATVNGKGEIMKYSTHAYRTPAISDLQMTFDVTTKDVTHDSAVFSIIPSDKENSYVYELIETAKYVGKTDDQIIDQMIATAGTFYSRGDQIDQSQQSLTPNTEYGIYVVGCTQQQPTTGLTKIIFKTKELVFDFNSDAYTEAKIVSIAENQIEGEGSGYVVVKAQLTPNESVYRYQPICGPASQFEGMSDTELAGLVAAKGESSEWYPENIWNFQYATTQRPLPANTDCMIIVLSRDADSNYGKLTKFEFHTTPTTTGDGEPEPPIVDPMPGV